MSHAEWEEEILVALVQNPIITPILVVQGRLAKLLTKNKKFTAMRKIQICTVSTMSHLKLFFKKL